MTGIEGRSDLMKGIGKTRAFVLSLLVVGVMVLTVGTAGAVTVTWNFATSSGTNLGTTESFTGSDNTTTILASGFSGVGSHSLASPPTNWILPAGGINAADLIGTSSGGLGVVNLGSNFIDVGQIIQLDVSNLIPPAVPAGEFTSEQASVSFGTNGTIAIYSSSSSVGSNAVGTYLASSAGTGGTSTTLSIPLSTNRYLWIYVTPNGAQGALGSVAATYTGDGVSSVPEPTSLLLLGTGLVGMGIGMRAWRRKK
jgi:LysM repeat protein